MAEVDVVGVRLAVGISGHQRRPGIDWLKVEVALASLLREIRPTIGFSSLAVGSDQLFASLCLQNGTPVTAVLPFASYDTCFKNHFDKTRYKELLAQCTVEILTSEGSDEQAFFNAGKAVADRSDVLIAIWDGKQSEGLGGTADIVDYSRSMKQQIRWIDVETYKVSEL